MINESCCTNGPAGCPNRCKHCWLGHEKNRNVKIEDYTWVANQFKDYKLNGTTYFNDYIFSSWYREPDYAENYKELWELDKKLSTSMPPKFELASNWRLARDDLAKIPQYLIDKTLINEGSTDFPHIWHTEKKLLPDLLKDKTPPNDNPPILAFMVSSDFNVYPNSGEIAEYANLGNLKSDGVDVVMDNFINRKTASLKMNYKTPVSYFAKKYGDINSAKLTSRYELCKKWLRLESQQIL